MSSAWYLGRVVGLAALVAAFAAPLRAQVQECLDCTAEPIEVACGDLLDGELFADGCALASGQLISFYELDLDADLTVEIALNSADYDTYLYLYDSACNQIGANDDGGPGLNSLLSLDLRAGSYLVGCTQYTGAAGTTGLFDLGITCREAPPPPPPLCDPDCLLGVAECGTTLMADFPRSNCVQTVGTARPTDFYELEVPAGGESLRIALNAAYDTYLYLYDEACNEVARDDDGGDGFNSLLEVDVPAGRYLIGASSFAATGAGNFTMTVSCTDGPPPVPDLCSEDCVVGTVSCGETLAGAFPQTACQTQRNRSVDLYEVLTTAGPLSISLTAGFDTYLHLYDENCVELAADDDGGEGFNSLIETDIGEGVYFIGVSSFSAGATGNFTLDVTCAGGETFCIQCRTGNVRPGETFQSTFPSASVDCVLPGNARVDVIGFNLSEAFRGAIRLESGAFDATLALFDSRCDEIDFNDNCGGDTSASCLEVDLAPGAYSLVVSSESPAASGGYLLTVTEGGPDARPRFYRGDAGADGRLAIDDAVRIFGWLFQGASAPDCLEAADANNSGTIDLTDGVVVLNYLFQGGAAPASPGPPGAGPCGTDTDPVDSARDLGCATYAGCN